MTLTRSFKETVKARIERDAEFRDALIREVGDYLLFGDEDTLSAETKLKTIDVAISRCVADAEAGCTS
jgi:hypothetical protein